MLIGDGRFVTVCVSVKSVCVRMYDSRLNFVPISLSKTLICICFHDSEYGKYETKYSNPLLVVFAEEQHAKHFH